MAPDRFGAAWQWNEHRGLLPRAWNLPTLFFCMEAEALPSAASAGPIRSGCAAVHRGEGLGIGPCRRDRSSPAPWASASAAKGI